MKIRSMSSMPCSRASLDLGPARRPELRLQLAAEAAQRRRRQHCLARAADPDREMVVRAAHRGADRRRDVTVLDQLDARARRADLLDQVVVARTVEDDRSDVVDHAAERVGDRADVVADRAVERDLPARARADRHLAHVHVGQRRQRAARRGGDHRDRVRAAARDHRSSFERIEREVVLLAAEPDHRSGGELLGLLLAADHDPAADRHALQREPRARERRLLRRLLSARPSQRAPASAARSVTRAKLSHWHGARSVLSATGTLAATTSVTPSAPPCAPPPA